MIQVEVKGGVVVRVAGTRKTMVLLIDHDACKSTRYYSEVIPAMYKRKYVRKKNDPN